MIVLLNNDTKVENDWLEHLVHAIEEKNTVASSYVITEGIPEKYYESNGSVSYMMYNIMNVFNETEEEFYPNGCSLIFRKSEIGIPFDDDYFYYGEDVYLGLKARFMGLKIKFVKNSVVNHLGGGSNSGNCLKTFYRERNKQLNLYLYFSPVFILKVTPYIILNHIARIVLSLFSRKLSLPGLLKAYFWFYINIPVILKKRKYLKQFCFIPEKDIISKMTSKVLNDDSIHGKIINRISCFYSLLVNIKPVEYYQKKNNQS